MGIGSTLLKILPKVLPVIIGAIGAAWGKIKGKDRKQEEIANTKGLNPEKSSADEIAELNTILIDYRQNIAAAAADMEHEMIVECSMMLQDIMDTFNEYNQDLKILRADSIKRKFNRVSKDLKGTFAEYVHRRISLDDPECVRILRLPAGDLKNQRLQELKQQVFVEAGNEIIRRIQETVDDFSETVEDAFTDHLERAEEKVQEKTEVFEELSTVADSDRETAESILLKADYLLAVCSYAEEELL